MVASPPRKASEVIELSRLVISNLPIAATSYCGMVTNHPEHASESSSRCNARWSVAPGAQRTWGLPYLCTQKAASDKLYLSQRKVPRNTHKCCSVTFSQPRQHILSGWLASLSNPIVTEHGRATRCKRLQSTLDKWSVGMANCPSPCKLRGQDTLRRWKCTVAMAE